MSRLRALNDSDAGSCDWGGCDDEAVLARHDPALGWLPVCGHHAYARHLSVVAEGSVDAHAPAASTLAAGATPGGGS